MAKTFTVVFIPAALDQPIKECVIEIPEGKDIECLTMHCKEHFATLGGSASQADEENALMENLKKSLPAGQNISDDMMRQVMSMGSLVDTVPLVLNTKEANFIGVNFYVDDRGSTKGLPVNVRASQIAQLCQRMVTVVGDAFLSRLFDNDDDFTRMDFNLSELDSGAPWMNIARLQAAKSAGPSGMKELKEKMEQVSASDKPVKAKAKASPKRKAAKKPKAASLGPPLPPAAEEKKGEGNAHFSKKRWAEAIASYSEAIAIAPDSHVLYSNRSAARLGDKQYDGAVADAQKSLELQPKFVKGFYRLAKAHMEAYTQEQQGQAEAETGQEQMDTSAADGGSGTSAGGAGASKSSRHLHSALVALQGGLTLDPKSKDLLDLGRQAQEATGAAKEKVQVPFRLEPSGERGDVQAIFGVPDPLVPLIASKEITARGGRFALSAGPGAGEVSTIFYSPTPEVTAGAIAERLALRVQDPNPPGAEECIIS